MVGLVKAIAAVVVLVTRRLRGRHQRPGRHRRPDHRR